MPNADHVAVLQSPRVNHAAAAHSSTASRSVKCFACELWVNNVRADFYCENTSKIVQTDFSLTTDTRIQSKLKKK